MWGKGVSNLAEALTLLREVDHESSHFWLLTIKNGTNLGICNEGTCMIKKVASPFLSGHSLKHDIKNGSVVSMCQGGNLQVRS